MNITVTRVSEREHRYMQYGPGIYRFETTFSTKSEADSYVVDIKRVADSYASPISVQWVGYDNG